MNFTARTSNDFVLTAAPAAPFLPEFDKLTPDEKSRFVSSFLYTRSSKEGLSIPFDIASECIFYYLNVMGTHGFHTRPGTVTGNPVPSPKMITYAEDFNAPGFQKWLTETLDELEHENEGWEHYFKLAFGMYTPEALEEIQRLYPNADIRNKEDRMTVFVVGYSLEPSPPGPRLLNARGYQAPNVYDFGGLQP